jgi:Cell division protein ZapA.
MKNESISYKVNIAGEEYNLISDEREEHVMQAASLVDSAVQAITQNMVTIDAKKAAILTALQMASTVLHTEQELQKYKIIENDFVTRMLNQMASL